MRDGGKVGGCDRLACERVEDNDRQNSLDGSVGASCLDNLHSDPER